MRMKTACQKLGATLRTPLVVVALVAVTALVTRQVISDEKPGQSKAHEEMAAKWRAMNSPGPFHKNMDPMVGDWVAASKYSPAPGVPPEVNKGTCRNSWIMGGRFIKQEYRGKAMGEPFEGLGILGYDNMKKQYTSSWVDNMTTGIMADFGVCDESGKVFTFESTHPDPMTGKPVKMKSVTRVVNKDKHVFEMFREGPDGKMFKNLEITYTRKK
ncbi:MAG: DUF1579 domain-containing protein [Phycisphaerae bacterium]